MKKIMLIALAAVFSFSVAQANEITTIQKAMIAGDILNAQLEQSLSLEQPLLSEQPQRDLINWQIGDYHEFKVAFIPGMGGEGTKSVREEVTHEGDKAIWFINDMTLMGQTQKSEVLLRRKDGKVLKMLVNGEEQSTEGGEFEIIEQGETQITVPAGTFDCMYIKGKQTSDGKTSEIELWANPIDVNLDGGLKTVVKGGGLPVPVTLTLTAFGHK